MGPEMIGLVIRGAGLALASICCFVFLAAICCAVFLAVATLPRASDRQMRRAERGGCGRDG